MGLSSNFCQNIILLFLQRDLQRIFVPGNYQLYKYNYGSLEKEAACVGNVYTTIHHSPKLGENLPSAFTIIIEGISELRYKLSQQHWT